jgi:lipopolysaccharide/colanic/teichoic acid biosynthesis glycosyltransferase
LRFRKEQELLSQAEDTEAFYLEHCVPPRKIELNLEYARRAGLWSDTVVILRTLAVVGLSVQAAHSRREKWL